MEAEGMQTVTGPSSPGGHNPFESKPAGDTPHGIQRGQEVVKRCRETISSPLQKRASLPTLPSMKGQQEGLR